MLYFAKGFEAKENYRNKRITACLAKIRCKKDFSIAFMG
jgi:hypothetical protein